MTVWYEQVLIGEGDCLKLPAFDGILLLQTEQTDCFVQIGKERYKLLRGRTFLTVKAHSRLVGHFCGDICYFAAV